MTAREQPTSTTPDALPVSSRRGTKAPARLSSVPRRRKVPYLLLGVLLIAVCTVGGVVLAAGLSDRVTALALARDVSAGQRLDAGDLREVALARDTGLHVIPAAKADEVAGRSAAYTLPAGTLLTTDAFGTAKAPPAGQAIAARALKAGQFPPGIEPGQHVAVVATVEKTDSEAEKPKASVWPAVVVHVGAEAQAQTTVVSLQLASAGARSLAGFDAEHVTFQLEPVGHADHEVKLCH